MNLLIYYNPNHFNFYIVYTNYYIFNHEVGFINSYGHILVQTLYYDGHKLVNVLHFSDLTVYKHKKKLIVRVIEYLIRFLTKVKNKMG